MGWNLRRMIRDGAPASWTPLMRLVAAEIADDARDPDGEQDSLPWSTLPISGFWDSRGRWREGLTERTGATASGISHALTKLARAGYELRQPIQDETGKPVTDKRGRPVLAAKGHAVRFQVPVLAPREAPQRSHESTTYDDQRWRIRASKVADPCNPSYSESHQSSVPLTAEDQSLDLADVEGARAEGEAAPKATMRNGGAGSSEHEPDPATKAGTDLIRRRYAAQLDAWIAEHPEAEAAVP
jgi:hypothetical protein